MEWATREEQAMFLAGQHMNLMGKEKKRELSQLYSQMPEMTINGPLIQELLL